MTPLPVLVLLAFLALGGLFYLRWFLLPPPSRLGVSEETRFGGVDVAFGGLLVALFLWSGYDGLGQKVVVTTNLILESCFIYFCLLVLVLGMLGAQRKKIVALFGLRWTDWKKGLSLALVALAAFFPLLLLIQSAVVYFCGPADSTQGLVDFLVHSVDWPSRLLVAGMAIVVAPVCEELLLRGYLFGVMRQYLGFWPALVGSSLVFALMHAHLPSVPGLFAFACLLALVYQRTGSLWASMAVHSAFNATTVIISIFFPSVITP